MAYERKTPQKSAWAPILYILRNFSRKPRSHFPYVTLAGLLIGHAGHEQTVRKDLANVILEYPHVKRVPLESMNQDNNVDALGVGPGEWQVALISGNYSICRNIRVT